MKRILLASVAGVALMATSVFAADVALIIGNGEYSALRDIRGGTGVTQAADEIAGAGFDVISRADASTAEILAALEEFAAISQDAGRVLVILSGRFMHSGQDAWLLPVDSEGTPQFARLPGEALPLSSIMAILGTHPGQAILLLATDEDTARSSSPYLSRGIGPLTIAQGVTVFSGGTRAVAGFAEDVLALPAMSLTVQAARRQGLQGAGFLPEDYRFLGEKPTAAALDSATSLPSAQDEETAWQSARQSDTVAAYQDYLARFPAGKNIGQADGLIREILTEPNRADRLLEAALGLKRNHRRDIQRDLSILGFNPRGIDGLFGPGSRGAISTWQTAGGFSATSYLTREQISQLNKQAERRSAELEAEAELLRLEQERQDREYWQASGAAGDEPGLRAYLKRYPDGVFAEVAQTRLNVFEEQNRAAAAAQDRAKWDATTASGTPEAYRDYLETFPGGAFATEAQGRIDELTRDDANSKELEAAQRAENRLGLNGQTRALVEARLAKLELKPGPVDGNFDDRTRRAIRRYQNARKIPVTGYLNQQTVVRLLADSILR